MKCTTEGSKIDGLIIQVVSKTGLTVYTPIWYQTLTKTDQKYHVKWVLKVNCNEYQLIITQEVNGQQI